MKLYKVVVADFYAKKAQCKEFTIDLSGNRRSDEEFILNHYAAQGWKLVNVIERTSTAIHFYLEKDSEQLSQS